MPNDVWSLPRRMSWSTVSKRQTNLSSQGRSLNFFSRIKLKFMDETNEGLSIPDDVQATVDGWENWRNPCQMIHEITVDEPYQEKTYHTRWCTKQLLMDETDKEIHSWWCTKQLLMDETNVGPLIPDDAQRKCWWTRQMKISIPDDARNNWWSMRLMKHYPYQKRCKITVDGWDSKRNPYQMKYETAVDGWDKWRTTHTSRCAK